MSVHTRVQHRAFESAAQEAAVSLLVAAAHVLQRMNGLLREHGITHDQYNVLRILRGAHPHGHAVAEVGKRMISRAPDVTRLLDRLERRGLIDRAWAPDNRRVTLVRISPRGQELLAAVDPQLHALQQELMRESSPEELDVLTRVCGRLVS
jgi:DNA-binding MarR family transcriptional regulator